MFDPDKFSSISKLLKAEVYSFRNSCVNADQ
ncbi:Uncharacterised protein [Serratia fonticola]|nr:hypothetical protein HAP32_00034 [Serratia fonticola]RDL26427.1 hypothetical protein DFO62_104236 [Serratia fonticola]CAI0908927.1 Uncharacterised protein [Serratia fonticola]CAI1007883.1 Uncharacterised protein [Serratia fonticola]